ncbi:hypothetical protein AQUCO_04500050v1 [Aquilegia coerulea]|uniref:Yippee domain-containing protein n=1 Tax=Aquilegia coerulea TaxID=218851 RepID=A0A2G5CLI4_AQUCA|nr:hypothetical protein AQUCO_04500050v1 [Aquilegia coerulea]
MGGGSVHSIVGMIELAKEGKTYCCKGCQTHLALSKDVKSKNFHTKSGSGYLFNNVVNIFVGMKEEQKLMTGKHTISDIFCNGCCTDLGWKYETAYEEAQKYKEGKFILEKSHLYDAQTFFLSTKAYEQQICMFNSVNVFVGKKEERIMISGMHTVADIFCIGCRLHLGWKYEAVDHESQKYKEGKSVLERIKILGPDGHNPSDTLAVQIDRLQVAEEEKS